MLQGFIASSRFPSLNRSFALIAPRQAAASFACEPYFAVSHLANRPRNCFAYVGKSLYAVLEVKKKMSSSFWSSRKQRAGSSA